MLSLTQLKKLHKEGMNYAKKEAPWFFPPIKELIALQEELVQNAKNLNEFMSAVSISPPSFTAAFNVPKPLCENCLLETTPPQFGQGPLGWYFLVGNFGNMAYNFTFVRTEIAPPGAVKFPDRNEAVRWSILGGYGTSPEDWVTIPYDFIYMKYQKLTYSTFVLTGSPGQYISHCTLKTVQPMTFSFEINFKDKNGKDHSISAVQVSRVPPQRNAPGAVTRFGLPGLASLYWSYTDMDVPFCVVDEKTYMNGKGWLDHQTFKLAGVMGFLPNSAKSAQVFFTVLKSIMGAKPVNWTWMYIQDEESGIQYMLSAGLPKGYNDNPSSFKAGLVLTPNGCNVYKKAVPHNMPSICSDARIEVVKVQTVGGHPYPLEYKVTLPGGKIVLSKAIYGLNLFMNGPGQISCESPGVVFDETGQKKIGYSTLEINGPLTKRQAAANMLKNSGANPADQTSLNVLGKGQDQEQPLNRKIVAWILFLLPFILFILYIVLIFVGKKQRWERLGLFVAMGLALNFVIASMFIACWMHQ